MTPSTIDDLRQILGPCPKCERQVSLLDIIDPETERPMTEAELARILALRREMMNDPASARLVRFLDNLRYVCARCAHDLTNASEQTRRREAAAMLKREAYSRGLMPHSALAARFDSANPEFCARNPEAWATARRMPPPSLWIAGPKGVGKTHMAECILNACLEQNLTAAEVAAHAISDHGAAREDIRRDFIRRYATVAVLLIDDIDKPTWGPLGFDVLWRIIDSRSRDRVQTLITANFTGAEVRAHWAKRHPDNASVIDSMFDRLTCSRVVMAGQSLRGAA